MNHLAQTHPCSEFIDGNPLSGTDDASYPFWSPDSREIGFFADGKMKKIDTNGGPPQVLWDAGIGRGGAWSKNGVIVFSPGPAQGLMRVSAAGGPPEPATKLDVSRGENRHRWPFFLPDGKHLLFFGVQGRRDLHSGTALRALGATALPKPSVRVPAPAR